MKKKTLSVLLSAVFAVQLQAFAANVTTGTVSDGSSNYDISLANPAAGASLLKDVPGTGGKEQTDVVYKAQRGDSDNGTDGNTSIFPYYQALDMGKSAVMSMDVMFASENARLYFGYGAAKENAKDRSEFTNIKVMTIGAKNGVVMQDGMKSSDDSLPDSLSLNEWHNIAIEVPNDGTDVLYIYIDGEKYSGSMAANSFGARHFRFSLSAGTVYFDNYTYNITEHGTDAYDETAYQMNDISVTENEKFSYDAENKSFELKSETLTAAELKQSVSAEYTLKIYNNASYSNVLADSDIITDKSIVTVNNSKGAYHYYSFKSENTSLFTISPNSDGISCTVTGFKVPLTNTEAAIPQEIAGYTVTAIGNSAFENDTKLTSVVLPDTVTEIGSKAFKCPYESGQPKGRIKNVVLSENLRKIGDEAFYAQIGITEFDFPYGLQTIGASAFYSTGLKNIFLPDNVTSMGINAFRICQNVETIKMPSGMSKIPDYCFYSGSKVKEVIIPPEITAFGTQVFRSYNADMKIYGESGSYAEQAAKENLLEFVPITDKLAITSQSVYGGSVRLTGSGYNLAAGYTDFSVHEKITNIGNSDKSVKALIAVYDSEKKLVGIGLKDIAVPAHSSVDVNGENGAAVSAAVLTGSSITSLVWSGEDLKPICKPYTVNFDEEFKEIHVLSIANSFCNDSFSYLGKIAAADNVIIKTQNLFIGGARLEQHYNNIKNNSAVYQPIIDTVYQTNTDGSAKQIAVSEAIGSDKWDVVVLQAATHGLESNDRFVNYADDAEIDEMLRYITDYISEKAPDAERIIHSSWGPSDEQSKLLYDGRFAKEEYPASRQTAFAAYKDAYKYASEIYSTTSGKMVPTSDAILYALDELKFPEYAYGSDGNYDTSGRAIYRDNTCHLTLTYGRVLAGLTWYEYLTGNDVTQNPYQLDEISDEDMKLLKQAAHYACSTK